MNERHIQSGDRVTLHYRLSCLGREIVNTFPDAPETFRMGTGEIDARLERMLSGLTAGTHETHHLMPGEAFGERDETLIQTLPSRDFPEAVPVGHQAEFKLPNGQSWLGTIAEVGAQTVKVDFNHPLAGLPIELEVQIIAIDHDQ
jgi:FKBP-type peptidyl-prolyl cis-trans isomerase SlpA